jgi:hypothetical protein
VTWHSSDLLVFWGVVISLLAYVRREYPWFWFRIFGYLWIGLFAELFLEKLRGVLR